ncbi:MAG: serine hydrolase domain-containing protein [Bacillota bacterium]|nr:serine hydrolase domain-containing protein [Bacillota bacterium]
MFKTAFGRLLVFCFLAGQMLVGSGVKAAEESNHYKNIDDYLQAQMKQQSIAGLSYAIVKNHKIVHENAFGQADLGRPMTPETPVRLASLSKSFTALAVMQLVEQGKVKLDEPVKTYIPWFKVDDKDASSRITIRNLLNQVSGLSGDVEMQLENELSGISMADTVRLLKKVKLTNPVGSKFQYTDFNYVILGMVVQIVSGEHFDQYIQKHILTPIGMKNSFTSMADAKKHGLSKSFAPWFGLLLPTKTEMDDMPNFLASGNMTSSVDDMGNYLLAYMDGGKTDHGQILSGAGIKELQQPSSAATMSRNGKFFAQYAMGWWSRNVQGVPVVGHAGDLLSTCRTDMYILPEQKTGIVILSNTHTGSLAPGNLHVSTDGVISLLAGKQPKQNNNGSKYARYYFIVDTVVLLFLLVVIRSYWNLRKWKKTFTRTVHYKKTSALLLGIQFLGPILMTVLSPNLFHFPSWSFLFCVQPDLVSSLLVILSAICALAVIKITIAVLHLISEGQYRNSGKRTY